MDLRLRLLAARTEHDFKKLLLEHMKELAEEHVNHDDQAMVKELTIEMDEMVSIYLSCTFNNRYQKINHLLKQCLPLGRHMALKQTGLTSRSIKMPACS